MKSSFKMVKLKITLRPSLDFPYSATHSINFSGGKYKIEKARRLANKPEEAEKLMRETMKKGEKVKEEVDSIAASFERFKAALREELSRDFGGSSKPRSSSNSNTRVGGDRRTSRK